MDCSEVRRITTGWLETWPFGVGEEFLASFISYSRGEGSALLEHTDECPACTGWVGLMVCAGSTDSADEKPEDDFDPERLLREGLISRFPEGCSRQSFLSRRSEELFLELRRQDLRILLTEIAIVVARTQNPKLRTILENMREHIDWADDLEVKRGIPSECVFPGRDDDSSED